MVRGGVRHTIHEAAVAARAGRRADIAAARRYLDLAARTSGLGLRAFWLECAGESRRAAARHGQALTDRLSGRRKAA
jgi:hypothetical protein